MKIREAVTEDAAKLAALMEHVDRTSPFMLWEPGERKISLESQQKMIEGLQNKENGAIFVAEQNNELIGYLIAIGGNANKNKHSAYLVVGIHESYRGKGVGTRLFQELDQWATQHGLHRLELTVVARNNAGVSLYQKRGFTVEGTKKDSLRIHDEYVDEYYMAKILNKITDL